MAKCCCCCDQFTVKKGIWTPEEDEKLIAYVNKYGHWNWRRLPKYAGLSRCGKSCRLRWMNYLRPNIKRGGFSKDEEETITQMYATMGGRWSTMASLMPGRTDNDIKNHWNTILKRRLMKEKIKKKKMSKPPPFPPPPAAAKASLIQKKCYNSGEILISNNQLSYNSTLESELNETVETPTAMNADMFPVNDQLPAISPASSAGDFWTDPLWLDSNFDFEFDYQDQALGESNFFYIGLDEYLLQENLY